MRFAPWPRLDAPLRAFGVIRVFVKIRVLPSMDATLSLARRLEAAGCSLLTVHGRTREQKTGCACDWAGIATVKAALGIPVLANGGIETPEDVGACLAATGCDGVMSSEAALENPAVLSGTPTSRSGQASVTREYVAFARAHPPRATAILKAHLFKLLFLALEAHRDLRERLGAAMEADVVLRVAEEACSREEALARARPEEMNARCDRPGAPFTTWYRRHRNGPPGSDPLSSGPPADVAPVKDARVDAALAKDAQPHATLAGGAPANG